MRKTPKEKLCGVHKAKGYYAARYCYACFRVNLDSRRTARLKKLFPNIMKEDKDA